ncbi:MAG: fumarylacetoacetate hydrolase family protein, partial [Armatimonadota bacterium]
MPFSVPSDARSWVEVKADSHFPIQNLPFGLAAPKGQSESVAVAIGDQALLLLPLAEAGLIDEEEFPGLESFLELTHETISALREVVYDLLRADNTRLRDNKKLRERALIHQGKANMQVPVAPTSFVDFYSGIHHASNVGRMFRPDQPPLLPNYRNLPVAYNGRASSVVASGTSIIRPKGQTKGPDQEHPHFAPTLEMDFELELGYYISHGQDMGKRITCASAEEHILGLLLVNDWSARDIQFWEGQPLGPFLGKSFATGVSPWVVPLEALESARVAPPPQDPEPLGYLQTTGDTALDLALEVDLNGTVISRPPFAGMYWTA